jgi:hypothetical protein
MIEPQLWDRLRAALDAWEAPAGLRLYYAIDERSGRVAINVVAPCGGGVSWDGTRQADAAELADVIRPVPSFLDYVAFKVIREHLDCYGTPRTLTRHGREFVRWIKRYRHTCDARRARSKSPWTR